MNRKIRDILRKAKKFELAHIKAGMWGGIVGMVFVFLAGVLHTLLIMIGGFIGVFLVRKKVRVGWIEGLKVGVISAVITSFYSVFLFYRLDYSGYEILYLFLTVFMLMIAGSTMGIVFFKPRKKMH
ncbi:MAG: hypothetical protein U9N35_02000 [Euryarchaeota archaeon]|nr:hypothetical protein [Euryarchaeota archaeon]